MHAQNTIIFIGMAFGLALLGYYIRKLILRAMARSYEAGLAERNGLHSLRITALNSDLATITQLRNQEAQELTNLRRRLNGIKATVFISTDYRNLTEITKFLALALQTWKALKGTESTQARAKQLIKISRALEHRVFHTVEMANSLNAQPLDTQLIEWLDKRGSFYAEPELSSISFPHNSDLEGYNHLRDALREAYELDMKRQAIELGQLPAENAA
ncbi:hypothetical protein LOY38_18475 [Pseudomonas sp. B21-015]|uniref:hypothetical protein n=1 Tax=Pseudomonas sp. B21-015 TaxID=2895473 RepID=UPI002160AE4B|nr:hypothetical protein [Pseudomonas sp. B21-015]UVM48368.1 hypothetical protein LOY38_18475 [Pseudomonas sp. B21-015]